MQIINTKDDVHLQQYIEGTEKRDLIRCECCNQINRPIIGGKHRCQTILVKKNKLVRFKSDGAIGWVNYYGQCSNQGTKEIDGKSYCLIHAEKILLEKLGEKR
jgi:hypothetical protein